MEKNVSQPENDLDAALHLETFLHPVATPEPAGPSAEDFRRWSEEMGIANPELDESIQTLLGRYEYTVIVRRLLVAYESHAQKLLRGPEHDETLKRWLAHAGGEPSTSSTSASSSATHGSNHAPDPFTDPSPPPPPRRQSGSRSKLEEARRLLGG